MDRRAVVACAVLAAIAGTGSAYGQIPRPQDAQWVITNVTVGVPQAPNGRSWDSALASIAEALVTLNSKGLRHILPDVRVCLESANVPQTCTATCVNAGWNEQVQAYVCSQPTEVLFQLDLRVRVFEMDLNRVSAVIAEFRVADPSKCEPYCELQLEPERRVWIQFRVTKQPYTGAFRGMSGTLASNVPFAQPAPSAGSVTALQQPEAIVLKSATATDRGLAISYDVNADSVGAFPLLIYRANNPMSFRPEDVVQETQLSDPALLTRGPHVGVTLGVGRLPVVPSRPYVIVQLKNSTSSVYFRKWLIGAVTHGYSRASSQLFGYTYPALMGACAFRSVSTGADPPTSPLQADVAPAWELAMQDDLKGLACHDAAIAYHWVNASADPQPGHVVAAAGDLITQLMDVANALRSSASFGPLDAIDLHLIGHSRGTGVMSQVLQKLAGKPGSALANASVQVTLLDPHPANNAPGHESPNVDSAVIGPIMACYIEFQTATEDPPIVLPAGAGITGVEVWYQHNRFDVFPTSNDEFRMNLWGLGPGEGIVNDSGVAISFTDAAKYQVPSFPIGHSEVPDAYRREKLGVCQ